eukprot:2185355-Lingulodinium_polyedra.AAC.1
MRVSIQRPKRCPRPLPLKPHRLAVARHQPFLLELFCPAASAAPIVPIGDWWWCCPAPVAAKLGTNARAP